MGRVLIACLIAMMSVVTAAHVLPQNPLAYRSGPFADGPLLTPENSAYADAMELARFLNDRGIHVQSLHSSKLEILFTGIEKAAFLKAEKGVLDVVFFPEPRSAEKVKVTEQRLAGRYLYSFHGQPNPKPHDGFDADRPVYFLTHRNWFITLDNRELYDAIKSAFGRE